VNAPGKTVALGRGVDLVLLRVIKIFDRQARLAFAQGRVGQRAGGRIRVERAQVMLQAGDQRHMAQGFTGRQRRQEVAHHGRIDRDVLGLRCPAHPGRDEHMGRRHLLQRGGQAGGVEQVRRHGAQAGHVVFGLPRKPVSDPSVGDQFARDTAAADAAGAYDQSRSLHDFFSVKLPGYRVFT
jgi:hypothetical protein